jgi:hypothetical protein
MNYNIVRFFAVCVIVIILDGCSGSKAQPAARVAHKTAQPVTQNFNESAYLKAIRHNGEMTYTAAGPMTGDIQMTMTLVIDYTADRGTYNAVGRDGTLFGEISISRPVQTRATIYEFSGHGTVTHGTRAYTHSRSSTLGVHGKIVVNRALLNLTLSGKLYS